MHCRCVSGEIKNPCPSPLITTYLVLVFPSSPYFLKELSQNDILTDSRCLAYWTEVQPRVQFGIGLYLADARIHLFAR